MTTAPDPADPSVSEGSARDDDGSSTGVRYGSSGGSPERSSEAPRADNGQDLYFALVTPVGIDTAEIASCLQGVLAEYDYDTRVIRLSLNIRTALGLPAIEYSNEYERVTDLIARGDELCEKTRLEAAILWPAISELRATRAAIGGHDRRTAYVFSSIKRPREIDLLRTIYGPSFFAIGIHASLEVRRKHLIDQFQRSIRNERVATENADEVIQSDRGDGKSKYVQNILDTFPLADIYINTSDPNSGEPYLSLRRLVGLILGQQTDPLGTPFPAEFAMAAAYTSALRSASLSRRVGAALVDTKGQVVALGTNEAPKAFGGHYAPGDYPDGRDIADRGDYNKLRQRQLLEQLLGALAGEEHLTPQLKAAAEEGNPEVMDPLIEMLLDSTEFGSLFEFHRAVHAEASAILDAARHGVATAGCVLYCTTFPCHLCAKEILAAGVERVVFLEPYPKSRAANMYGDAIETEALDRTIYGKIPFDPYLGISPRRYSDLFVHGRSSAKLIPKRQRNPVSRFAASATAINEAESAAIQQMKPAFDSLLA